MPNEPSQDAPEAPRAQPPASQPLAPAGAIVPLSAPTSTSSSAAGSVPAGAIAKPAPRPSPSETLPGSSPPASAPLAGANAIATRPAGRQLQDLPIAELERIAEEFGLKPRDYSAKPLLVAAIHHRRALIASLDRDAMAEVLRWGRRPVPINATREQLAMDIVRLRQMRFDGLTQRGLLALARLRGIEVADDLPVPKLIKRLKKQEGFFARLNRKRRAILGSMVAGMVGGEDAAEAQADAADAGRSPTLKDDIEEQGLFGGIAGRIKKSADAYLNQKLDEIEARIDRKLDEIDRRLAEWRDKEIANRLRILKITLWVSVIVAVVALIYAYISEYFLKA